MQRLSGVWLPLITPFVDGKVDLPGYRRLVEHYIGKGVSGLIPLGTTGEAPTLDDDEAEAILAATVEVAAARVPVFAGIGGNATLKVVKTLKRLERHAFAGILSVCPYYNRPTQDGLTRHFTAIAEATDRPILVYNIPYRTSVNLQNETLLALARLPNIVGAKDSSGNLTQSLDLLARRPENFSVLTGEDALFFTMLANGADGGILAAAHLATGRFVEVARLVAANDHQGARALWAPLASFLPKLFQETNPIAVKHCLWRQGLIASPECRLPLGAVSEALARDLDEGLPRLA